MSKRVADRQINKDEYEAGAYDDEDGEQQQEHAVGERWKEADESKIAARKIVKVRRKLPAATSTHTSSADTATTAPAPAFPKFDFGAAATTTASTSNADADTDKAKVTNG